MSDELNFPLIKGEPADPRLYSMDEVDALIEHDYRHFFDRGTYEREKRLNSVNVRFSLDEEAK